MSNLGLTNFGSLTAPLQPLSDFDNILGEKNSGTQGAGLMGYTRGAGYGAGSVGAALDAAAATSDALTAYEAAVASSANGSGVDLVGGSGRVIDNISTLRTLLKTGVGKAFVLGYYAPGDGGGGQYYYDSTDTTSPDNNGTIIIANDGARWKLVFIGTLSVRQFGATDDNTSCQSAVQAAINEANARGGGIVWFPRKTSGKYNIGSGVTTYSNVVLVGDSGRYNGNSTRGVSLVLSGNNVNGIYCQYGLDLQVRNLVVDCSAVTGWNNNGIYGNGLWKSTLEHVTVLGTTQTFTGSITSNVLTVTAIGVNRLAVGQLISGQGVTPGTTISSLGTGSGGVGTYNLTATPNVSSQSFTAFLGKAIRIDTASPSGNQGAQHIRLVQCECADGIIKIGGTSGSDAVTSTVIDTCRGYMYDFSFAQVTLINANAEQWPDGSYGYSFNGSGTFVTMIGCDIENVSANAKAILQTNGASFREVGTIWAGFAGTGTNRVTGSSDTVRSYGGAFELVNTGMAAATPVTIGVTEDGNASYTRRELMPVNTGGGSQEGYERMYRRIAGTEILTHEFQRDYLIEHTKTFAAASATLVLNLTIPASRGIYVECQAEGPQNGDAVHSVFVQAVARNGSGTVAITAGSPLTIPASYAGVFTFVNNGGTLDIKWTPTTANSSQIFFTFRVRGALSGYTKA